MGVECFKADLHIHTCLSPCGHLEMSPRKIVESALERGLDIIAITDHNTTRNVRPCVEIGDELGLYVVAGCEVNTQEEVHCLCSPAYGRLLIPNCVARCCSSHCPDLAQTRQSKG
jgi:predicted metal-dependent phosphoesterase TrpH